MKQDIHTVVCGLVVVGITAVCRWCSRHLQITFKP